MVHIPQDDHSWFGDFIHAKNGWYDSGSSASMMGKQIRESQQASENLTQNHSTINSNVNSFRPRTSFNGCSDPPPRVKDHSPYWLASVIAMIGVVVALVATAYGAWHSFHTMPEIVALELWMRIPAAIGMGFLIGGVTYSLLTWFLGFVFEVLLPLIFRLVMFVAITGVIIVAVGAFF